MSELFYAVIIALQIAPYLGLMVIAPYVLYRYKKTKSIPVERCVYFYIFIWYSMSAYFLTMMPFPDRESVAMLTTSYTQLIPFDGIRDLMEHISQIGTIPGMGVLSIYIFLGMAFNIVLTVPLGFFVRFLFQLGWKKTTLIGFFVSLFYELTQISALFFIYPRPYRIFDVDDLIYNTLGAVIGWWLCEAIQKRIPSPEIVSGNRLSLGCEVSMSRRILAFIIDSILGVFLTVLLASLIPAFGKRVYTNDLIENLGFLMMLDMICMFLYINLTIMITGGKTVGLQFSGLTLYTGQEQRPGFVKVFIRTLFSYTGVLFIPIYMVFFMLLATRQSTVISGCLIGICAGLMVVYAWFFLTLLMNGITHGKQLFYDTITDTYLDFRHGAKNTKHIRFIKSEILNEINVDELSAIIFEVLKEYHYNDRAATKVRLLSEGVMLEWLHGGLENHICELHVDQRIFRKTLILSALGKEVPRKQTEEDYYHVLGGLRLSFETHYSGNRNICAIDL